MRRAVFLDRDGVINKPIVKNGQVFSPRRLEDFEIFDGLKQFLDKFRQGGFVNIVITNQPDIARGDLKWTVLEAMHRQMWTQLPIDDIIVCPHDDCDNCQCRKPKPGMLLRAAKQRNIDLEKSFVIGDQWKDVEAGKEAGCTTVLIDYPYNAGVAADFRIKDMSSAENIVLELTNGG